MHRQRRESPAQVSPARLGDDRLLSKLLFSSGQLGRRNPETPPQHPPELLKIDLAGQHLMLGQHQPKQVSAWMNFLTISVPLAMHIFIVPYNVLRERRRHGIPETSQHLSAAARRGCYAVSGSDLCRRCSTEEAKLPIPLPQCR